VSANYTHIANVSELANIPVDGTLSRTLHNDQQLKVVLFSFSAGQELSEHTASSPAIMHFLSGEAEVTLGSDRLSVAGGAWIHMPAELPHSICATTPTTMLLSLLKQTTAENAVR
jgi:quercetin dioxygenase-like cupin family protein